ncbi:MAG TPA: hypothetical protein VFD71_12485 [Planctomycetota bacterium]|nr:hypothetical protein [Planctomycetota bacterium]
MPVIGTQVSPYLEAGDWQFSYGYRYQKSDRHFVGDQEDKERESEHSQVINTIHLMDFSVTHAFSKRFSGTLALPVQFATRSSPIRDAEGDIISRDTQRANGIGDMVLSGMVWLLDPNEFLNTNVALSLGPKFPTGQDDVRHKATIRQGSNFIREERTVDQSIQPGDGGFGFVAGIQVFYTMFEKYTWFLQGSYLFNPRNTNGVPTFRTLAGEEVMSVADSYIGKAGLGMPIPFLDKYGFGCSLAGRVEGVPVRDVIGESDGFRRPGLAFSIEPGISWVYGNHLLGLSAPVALYRNRFQSVADQNAEPERHGDAAFADYLILFSYSWRFAGPARPTSPASSDTEAPPRVYIPAPVAQ